MKSLFGLISIFSSLFGAMDQDGWVSLERPKKSSFEEEEEVQDPSIWVVFAKELGAERFLVRFPEDPHYTYLSPEEMELFSSNRQGDRFFLRVLENPGKEILEKRMKEVAMQADTVLLEASQNSKTLDLLYRTQGKWVREHFLLTPEHLYFFQTSSDSSAGDAHRQFVCSLEIELLDK